MKQLIIILLFPFVCNAQISIGKIKFDTTKNGYTFRVQPNFRTDAAKVYNDEQKIIATVGSAHILKIYGDTLSVLKVIFHTHGIEIKNK